MRAGDDKYDLSITQGLNNSKLNQRVKYNHKRLTTSALSVSGLRFNLSTDYDNPSCTITSETKYLTQVFFKHRQCHGRIFLSATFKRRMLVLGHCCVF